MFCELNGSYIDFRRYLFFYPNPLLFFVMATIRQITLFFLSLLATLLKLIFGVIRFDKSGVLTLDVKALMWLTCLVIGSHLFSYSWHEVSDAVYSKSKRLYLLDYAGVHINNVDAFEGKVRQVGQKLGVPPEWLMAVMYSESRFKASAENYKGSGAVGLIQFMPATARDFGTSTEELSKLDPVEQLEYVYQYLNSKRERYGEFNSLTDLYLAILYPKAMSGDFCYTLYAEPSQAYTQNAGLDQDKDKKVTVRDIDRYLKRIFPTAYLRMKNGETADQHTDLAGIGTK